MTVTGEVGENVNFEITLNELFEKGWIERVLSLLKKLLIAIKREDLNRETGTIPESL